MQDKIMGGLALALLLYAWGCANRDWTGPVDIWRDVRDGHADNGWAGWAGVWADIVSGHQNRRSEPVDMPEDTDPPDVLSNVHPDDEDPEVEVAGGALIVGTPQRPWGPRPLDDLLDEHTDDEDDDAPARHTVAERRAWVAARLSDDDPMPLMEIYAMGAEIFGCSAKTIQRDKEQLAPRGDR
jgi:hypothetical protein